MSYNFIPCPSLSRMIVGLYTECYCRISKFSSTSARRRAVRITILFFTVTGLIFQYTYQIYDIRKKNLTYNNIYAQTRTYRLQSIFFIFLNFIFYSSSSFSDKNLIVLNIFLTHTSTIWRFQASYIFPPYSSRNFPFAHFSFRRAFALWYFRDGVKGRSIENSSRLRLRGWANAKGSVSPYSLVRPLYLRLTFDEPDAVTRHWSRPRLLAVGRTRVTTFLPFCWQLGRAHCSPISSIARRRFARTRGSVARMFTHLLLSPSGEMCGQSENFQ